MNEGLGPEKRLKKKKDFEKVFQKGNVTKNEWFIAKYVENDKDFARVGIVVSRKFGKAHVRNKFKRYVRETFRKMKNAESVDVVIFPRRELKKEFERITFEEFSNALKEFLKKEVFRSEKVEL